MKSWDAPVRKAVDRSPTGDRPRARAGQGVHWAGTGRVISGSIGAIRLADLRRAEAIVDGFDSLTDMGWTLRSLYPGPRRDRPRQWRN